MLRTLPSLDPVLIIAWMWCDRNALWLGYCYTNEVMRKRHSKRHAQTSHFHLYVNAPYVNKLCSTWGGESQWAYADHLDLVHLTTYQLLKSDNKQMIGNSSKFHSSAGSRESASGPCSDWMEGEPGRAKWFLTTVKLKWCVFLTYRLFSCCTVAAFIQSNFNLVLQDSINLWGCLQYKEDKKNAEWCGKSPTDGIFYVVTLR